MDTPDTNKIKSNGAAPPELKYLENLIRYRLNKFFKPEVEYTEPVMPALDKWQLPVSSFIIKHKLNKPARILLLAAIAPHIKPDLFERVIYEFIKRDDDFPQIGGTRGKNFRGFLPTGETALFLLNGGDWHNRLEVQQLFWADHLFGLKKVLWLEELLLGEPAISGRIILSQDYLDAFTYGKPVPPHFSMNFPAMLIHTALTWDDLVINSELQEQVKDIQSWVDNNQELMTKWGMQYRLRKGYRTLFYGPPGTGKTFTAGLLGKYTGKDVYRIDLSMVVSKYIGETEKNLELLFARAEDKGWILFFDEADALFGKRTNVRDAHDKYANQEVSYLLQRIEDYEGLIILATNMKNNIDDAFIRRFNSILKFPFPDAGERAQIWQKSFPKNAVLLDSPAVESAKPCAGLLKAGEINIPEKVSKYELSGGSIINVIHYAGIKAVERRKENKHEWKEMVNYKVEAAFGYSNDCGEDTGTLIDPEKLAVYYSDVLDGIRREMIKEGKPFTL